MQCVKCNAEIPKGSKFCMNCAAPQVTEKTCRECGAEIPVQAKFCIECGKAATD